MAWVQGPAAVAASAATNAATFSGSTPSGNLVVVVVTQLFGANPTRAITNVRDNVDTGVDYSLGKSQTTANTRVDIYYKVASSAGTRTVTVTFTGGSADSAIGVNEYDTTHTVLDATNGNSGSGTSITAGSVTPSTGALYVMGLTDETGGTLTGPGGSWSQRQEIESTGTCPIHVEDAITSGAQNPSVTLGTSGAWVAAIVTFVPSLPQISLQPLDQTIASGNTASFDTTVTGATSYQWQVLAASGSGGWASVSDGSGGTTADYTTATLTTSDRGKQWRLKATNSNGDTYSNIVGVRITSVPTSYDFSGFVIGAVS